jgi:hypothetical protein
LLQYQPSLQHRSRQQRVYLCLRRRALYFSIEFWLDSPRLKEMSWLYFWPWVGVFANSEFSAS